MTKPYTCKIYGREYIIRVDMITVLDRYVTYGTPTGDFLYAVLCNDFKTALGLADDENFANIQAYANYLYNEVPMTCQGSKERVEAWIKNGGLKGQIEQN